MRFKKFSQNLLRSIRWFLQFCYQTLQNKWNYVPKSSKMNKPEQNADRRLNRFSVVALLVAGSSLPVPIFYHEPYPTWYSAKDWSWPDSWQLMVFFSLYCFLKTFSFSFNAAWFCYNLNDNCSRAAWLWPLDCHLLIKKIQSLYIMIAINAFAAIKQTRLWSMYVYS